MADYWRLVYLESLACLRSLMPNKVIRIYIIFSVAAATLLMLTFSFTVPVDALGAGLLRGFSSLLITNSLICAGIFLLTLVSFLKNAQRLTPYQLSPRGHTFFISAPYAAAILLTSLGLFFFYIPFVVIAFRTIPATAVLLLLCSLSVLMSAMLFGLYMTNFILGKLGRVKATGLIATIGFLLIPFSSLGLPILLKLNLPIGFFWTFSAGIIAVFPYLMIRQMKLFQENLGVSTPVRNHASPQWGKINGWLLLKREGYLPYLLITPLLYFLLPLISNINGPLLKLLLIMSVLVNINRSLYRSLSPFMHVSGFSRLRRYIFVTTVLPFQGLAIMGSLFILDLPVAAGFVVLVAFSSLLLYKHSVIRSVFIEAFLLLPIIFAGPIFNLY